MSSINIEPSPSSASTCKKCQKTISYGEVRVKYSSCVLHLRCWKPPPAGVILAEGNFNWIRTPSEENKEKLRDQIKKWNATNETSRKRQLEVDTSERLKKIPRLMHPALLPPADLSESPIQGIPFDGLVLVFGRFPVWLLGVISTVCKSWKEVCNSDTLWSIMLDRYYVPDIKDKSGLKAVSPKEAFKTLVKGTGENKGPCAQCGSPGLKYSVQRIFLCNHCAGQTHVVLTEQIHAFGLTEEDVYAYDLRGGNIEVVHYTQYASYKKWHDALLHDDVVQVAKKKLMQNLLYELEHWEPMKDKKNEFLTDESVQKWLDGVHAGLADHCHPAVLIADYLETNGVSFDGDLSKRSITCPTCTVKPFNSIERTRSHYSTQVHAKAHSFKDLVDQCLARITEVHTPHDPYKFE